MTTIIGVDCATQPGKTGLALAQLESDHFLITEVVTGSTRRKPEEIISSWVATSRQVLLALDAPLGWPGDLAPGLLHHRAGELVTTEPDKLFHRHTDQVIQDRLGKRPFEVGANLIARTAHAALVLLDRLRRITKQDIQLAWVPGRSNILSAIEVYPAETRLVRGVVDKPGSLLGLEQELHISEPGLVGTSPHARDAIVCALAGADFLRGLSVPPDDMALAVKEGWIWLRK